MPSILDPKIDSYQRSLLDRYDEPLLLAMEAEGDERGFPIVGRAIGVTLELLSRSIGARRVMELGSGFGYSAYWFARAVGPDGEVHCTDGDPANAATAERYLTAAGSWDLVRYHVGDAVEQLATIDGDFDVVFCDIDKPGYPPRGGRRPSGSVSAGSTCATTPSARAATRSSTTTTGRGRSASTTD